MAEALFPDEAHVGIQVIDEEAYLDATTEIDSYDESGFERETETRNFFGGAKVVIQKPQNDGEITFGVRVASAEWDRFFWGGTGSSFDSTGSRKKHRVILLVTKDTSINIAHEEVGAYDTYRKVYAECYPTSWNPKLETEGMLEGEITFKIAPTDSDSAGNVRIDYSSTGIGSIGSYTASYKFDAV